MKSSPIALPCPPHSPASDVWEIHCTACGVRLFDGISAEELVERVYAMVQAPIEATGRIRGTWLEVLEEGDGELYAYWVRTARNFVGYEAIDTTDPEPTGERLSGLLLAELAGLSAAPEPVALPAPSWPVRAHRKASRWSRLKRWTQANAEREFVSIALPLMGLWSVALWAVLGWDGVKGVCGAVASIFS
ncbi:hypothetical protein [Streptomyces sp. NPDC005143]